MTADIITMGEMLIDFVPLKKGLPLKDNEGFLRMPGGAPANVAVGVAKLGAKSAFFGKVGDDPFGHLLIDTLAEYGVDTSNIITTDDTKTTLAFVTLDETGDRDFTFYRDPGADMLYKWEEVNQEILKKAKIFHYGSISLIDEPVRTATLESAKLAKANGILVSYDPNLRLPLWPDKVEALKGIKTGLGYADILKISEEELEFITGEKDIEKGVKILNKSYVTELIFVTLGADGCYFYNGKEGKHVSGYKSEVKDTTGAGDGFVAGVLSQIIHNNIKNIKEPTIEQLEEIAGFANAVGAITTREKGAIDALPVLEQVKNFLK